MISRATVYASAGRSSIVTQRELVLASGRIQVAESRRGTPVLAGGDSVVESVPICSLRALDKLTTRFAGRPFRAGSLRPRPGVARRHQASLRLRLGVSRDDRHHPLPCLVFSGPTNLTRLRQKRPDFSAALAKLNYAAKS